MRDETLVDAILKEVNIERALFDLKISPFAFPPQFEGAVPISLSYDGRN